MIESYLSSKMPKQNVTHSSLKNNQIINHRLVILLVQLDFKSAQCFRFVLQSVRFACFNVLFASALYLSRSYDNRSTELRPFDRRYCEGYRRLDPSRDPNRDRERDPHGAAETYYQRDFSPNMYDYRRGRERERERDESYRRKGSRRKHKRRRRRTRSYSPSSSVSTVRPKNGLTLLILLLSFLFHSALSVSVCL